MIASMTPCDVHVAIERRLVRRDDELVERDAERAPLLLHQPDDGVRNAANGELAADRIECREEVVGDVLPDHDHVHAALVLLRREEAAAHGRHLLDVEVVLGDRERLHRARLRDVPRLCGEVVVADDGVLHALGQGGDHRLDVGFLDARAAAQLAPVVVVVVADVDVGAIAELERVDRHDLADHLVGHVAAHAADDRHDGDQECDTDHHAEQGEEALELLHPDGLERESDGFEEGHANLTVLRGKVSDGG